MKKLVNKQIRIKAHEYLLQLKDSHEKTEHLYPSDKMQDYLQSMDITNKEKILLFKLRIWMIPVKANFSSNNRNGIHCELCDDRESEENQLHLLQCKALVNHPDLKEEIPTITYNDIFKDLASQVKAAKVWSKIMSVRKVMQGLKNKT